MKELSFVKPCFNFNTLYPTSQIRTAISETPEAKYMKYCNDCPFVSPAKAALRARAPKRIGRLVGVHSITGLCKNLDVPRCVKLCLEQGIH